MLTLIAYLAPPTHPRARTLYNRHPPQRSPTTSHGSEKTEALFELHIFDISSLNHILIPLFALLGKSPKRMNILLRSIHVPLIKLNRNKHGQHAFNCDRGGILLENRTILHIVGAMLIS